MDEAAADMMAHLQRAVYREQLRVNDAMGRLYEADDRLRSYIRMLARHEQLRTDVVLILPIDGDSA